MTRRPQFRSALLHFSIATAALACAGAHAQSSVSPEQEYQKAIELSQDVQPLGESSFGEQISVYNGALSFEQTDVILKGNGPLLQLSRTFHLQGRDEFFTTIPD